MVCFGESSVLLGTSTATRNAFTRWSGGCLFTGCHRNVAGANDRKNDVEGHHSKVGTAAWNRFGGNKTAGISGCSRFLGTRGRFGVEPRLMRWCHAVSFFFPIGFGLSAYFSFLRRSRSVVHHWGRANFWPRACTTHSLCPREPMSDQPKRLIQSDAARLRVIATLGMVEDCPQNAVEFAPSNACPHCNSTPEPRSGNNNLARYADHLSFCSSFRSASMGPANHRCKQKQGSP